MMQESIVLPEQHFTQLQGRKSCTIPNIKTKIKYVLKNRFLTNFYLKETCSIGETTIDTRLSDKIKHQCNMNHFQSTRKHFPKKRVSSAIKETKLYFKIIPIEKITEQI